MFTVLGNGDGSKPWYLVNPKIAGKWMSIPLKMVLIGTDPYPNIGNMDTTKAPNPSIWPWIVRKMGRRTARRVTSSARHDTSR